MKKKLQSDLLKNHSDIIKNFRYPTDRFKLVLENMINSYRDVDNGQHLSNLGDLLNYKALNQIR